MTNDEAIESIGDCADSLDNLLGALQLPMPDHLHVAGLKASLPSIRDQLRRIYKAQTGDDPWAHL